MVFYLIPPLGTVSLDLLENMCTVRFEFLVHLKYVESIEQFQALTAVELFMQNCGCLMEDSAHDHVAHFVLRLLSQHCQHLSAAVEAGERRLFSLRLQLMAAEELHRTLQLTAGRARRVRTTLTEGARRRYLDTVVSVTSAALLHRTTECRGVGADGCDLPLVRVPFATVAPLVARRVVSLSGGYALLRCRQLQEALCCLQAAALQLLPSARRLDERLRPLLVRLQRRLAAVAGERAPGGAALSAAALERHSGLLPPCMLTLHRQLRRRHRLPHRDRICFSLFLKDAGMPLEENISLWSGEYSRPAEAGSGCDHGWQRCQRRYQYSLRHMYGLEGRRVPYDSHSCQTLQERAGESVASCGGCPFVGFDSDALLTLLTEDGGLSRLEAAPLLASCRQQPRQCCTRYLQLLRRRHRRSQQAPQPRPGELPDTSLLESAAGQRVEPAASGEQADGMDPGAGGRCTPGVGNTVTGSALKGEAAGGFVGKGSEGSVDKPGCVRSVSEHEGKDERHPRCCGRIASEDDGPPGAVTETTSGSAAGDGGAAESGFPTDSEDLPYLERSCSQLDDQRTTCRIVEDGSPTSPLSLVGGELRDTDGALSFSVGSIGSLVPPNSMRKYPFSKPSQFYRLILADVREAATPDTYEKFNT